jgi:hypothetical protein
MNYQPSQWPLVSATLLSATAHEDKAPFPLRKILENEIGISALAGWLFNLINRSRIHFCYSYSAEGKIRTGFVNKFVRRRGTSAVRLYGKVVGEGIQVRYNPEKPEDSMVRAADNLGPAG